MSLNSDMGLFFVIKCSFAIVDFTLIGSMAFVYSVEMLSFCNITLKMPLKNFRKRVKLVAAFIVKHQKLKEENK